MELEKEHTGGGGDQAINTKSAKSVNSLFAGLVIAASLGIGAGVYYGVLANPANFTNGDPIKGHPIDGSVLGLMYKGGPLVIVALGLLLMLIVFSIERLFTLSMAKGSGSIDKFVQKVQIHLEDNNVALALEECDKQKGTVGNVVKEVLRKYSEMERREGMDKENKVLAIQKSLEESIALELPMLEKHLTILATLVSISTLIGLIGTVLGMIRAFSALATAGVPDAAALATGISEALINTALGITISTIATVMYNYFTSQIDTITYKIDEAGFSIVQTFAEKH